MPNNFNTLITGRGATAIYLILKHFFKGREIIVPANICYAAILPIYYSSNIPHFVDVDYPSGNMSVTEIKKATNQNTAAIIYPHMYGNVSEEIKKIKKFCQEKHLLLIEDCASAMGGSFEDGSPVGSVGDYAIFSTGHAKNIDYKNGGIITSAQDLNAFSPELSCLPLFTTAISKRQNAFSRQYNILRRANDAPSLQHFFLEARSSNHSDMFLYRLDNETLLEQIEQSFCAADTIKPERIKKYNMYQQNLPPEICYNYSPNSLPWRFSILVTEPTKRRSIIHDLLSKKLFVSDWYPCIAPAFGCPQNFPFTERAEQEILNFSLSIPDRDIIKICDIIKSIL